MAEAQDVALLLEGVGAWNKVGETSEHIPDLSGYVFPEGIDLTGINFSYTKLAGCSLKGAILRDSSFEQADLPGADLSGADLSNSNLHGANLKKAVFRDAIMVKALLSGTSLLGADFSRANLAESNFEEAFCYNPDFVMEDVPVELERKKYGEEGAHFDDANLAEAYFYKFEGYGVHFTRANMESAWLAYAKLLYSTMTGANLKKATLIKADVRFSDLNEVDFSGAAMDKADLAACDVRNSRFDGAMMEEIEFRSSNLEGAAFVGADMTSASLVEVYVQDADFTGARIYGVSAWDMTGEPKSQKDLLISRRTDGSITTDEIEVAQFLYLMYNNRKIRDVLNTIQTKSVLILGRFTPPERKEVLDGLRTKLREKNLLPIVFDFDRPDDRDYTETVQTLAGMSLFVIVDVTSPKSTPLELEATAKQFKIPYLPILDTTVDSFPFAMLQDLQNQFHWVLPTRGYQGKDHLMLNLDKLIKLAMDKHTELRSQKANQQKVMSFEDL